jgi:glycosyltransferase involved in cell wall biosynthesis
VSSNPIKLLIIPSWFPPDGGYFFKEHSEALAEKGFAVDILVNRITGITTLKMEDLKYLKRFNVGEGNGVRIVRSFYLKLPGLEKINVVRWIRKTGKLFGKYVKKFGRPDMIIAHSSIWAGCAAEHIFLKYEIPYIIVEHRSRYTGITEGAEKMFRKFYFPMLKKAFFAAEKIITVSFSLNNKIIEIEPSSNKKILTIPELVDTGFFKLPENPRNREPFRVFSAGILEKIKGIDVLIRAFAGFLEKFPDARLRIAGRGSLLRELTKLAEDLGIKERVKFLGYLDREGILREMREAKIFVLASRFEAFGIVLIEAMATGLPVIATRSGGPGSIVSDDAGILTDLENEEQLTLAMIKIYEHYDHYDQEKIRKQILEKYSREVVMNKYAELIDEILGD